MATEAQPRKPLAKKRAKKRKDSRPRCMTKRCTRAASVVLDHPTDLLPHTDSFCLTHAKREADRLCRENVLNRDEWTCRNCGGNEVIQWAHILTRSALALRWDEDNSLALCRACHFFYTVRPLAWEDFINETFPGRWQELHDRRNAAIAAGTKPDYAAIIAELRDAA